MRTSFVELAVLLSVVGCCPPTVPAPPADVSAASIGEVSDALGEIGPGADAQSAPAEVVPEIVDTGSAAGLDAADGQASTTPDSNLDSAPDAGTKDAGIMFAGTDPCGDYQCLVGDPARIEVCPPSVAVPLAAEATLTAVARCGECSWLGVQLIGDPGFHVGAALNGGNSSADPIIYGSTTVQHLSPGKVLPIWVGNMNAKAGAQAKMSVAYLPGYTENWDYELGWLFSEAVLATAAP